MQKHMRDIRESTDSELKVKLNELQENLYYMRVNAKTGQMEKTSDIKKERKVIARVFTEISSRKQKALVQK